MSFLSPIWLVLLLPWALLAIHLFTGQRERVAVPFLPLWDKTISAPKAKRSFRAPPLPIMLLLVAMLLAIVAAAGPGFAWSVRNAATLIIDRGVTMSTEARWPSEPKRAEDMMYASGYGQLLYRFIPRAEETDEVELKVPDPSAENSQNALNDALRNALGEDKDPVVIVSDQIMPNANLRIVQMTPNDVVQNVGIVSVSARATPKAQVMVRMRNQSDLTTATMTARSGDAVQTQQIQLPPREGEQNYFIDLPKFGDVIDVKIDAKDDLPIDNVAWLVRRQAWPKIEPVDPPPAEVQRMVEVYQKNRPSSANSSSVVVATDVAHLPAGRPGIVITSGSFAPIDRNALNIVPHELTRDIDWHELASSATNAALPSNDWTPLVLAGDRVLLAIREDAKQALIAIDPRLAASSPQFVVLWGKLFDWAGQGGDAYATERVHPIDGTWKLVTTDDASKRYDPPLPGVYRRSDGALLAMSALDVKFTPPKPFDRTRLDAFLHANAERANLRPPLLAIAMLAALASLWLLKPHRSPATRTMGNFASETR
jgi:hypothetical protein